MASTSGFNIVVVFIKVRGQMVRAEFVVGDNRALGGGDR